MESDTVFSTNTTSNNRRNKQLIRHERTIKRLLCKKQETRQKKKEPHCGSFFAVLKRLFVVRHFNACVGERKRRAWVNVAVHLVCVASAVRVFGDKDFARQELASAPTADAASATIGAGDACAFERNQHVFVGVARDIVFLIAHLHVQVENFVFCLLRIAGEFPRFFCRTEQLFAVEFLFDAEFFDFAVKEGVHRLRTGSKYAVLLAAGIFLDEFCGDKSAFATLFFFVGEDVNHFHFVGAVAYRP